MESNVFFYSERGLINCLVLDLKNNLEKTKNFFKLIKFGVEEIQPSWADRILSIDWFVEFSASEFGNPDLIANIHCTDKQRVVFFEAKLRSYKQSALPMDLSKSFDPQKDGVYKGKASSINAQLALRYRLAQVLMNIDWSQINQMDEYHIEESYDKTEQYHDIFKDIRAAKTGRRIHNQKMIDVLYKLSNNKPDYYFVAMTFEGTETHTISTIQKDYPNLLPPIGIEQWKTANEQFGILNFNELSKTIPNSLNSYLSLSREYINLDNPNDIDSEDYIEQESKQEEIVINGEHPLDEASDGYDDWRALLRSTAKNQYKYRSERSSSILKGTQTIIKLIRRRGGVYLGFRDQLPNNLKVLLLPNESFSIGNVRFDAVSIYSASQEVLLDAVKTLL